MENHIQVYYAKIPAQYGRDTLYPPARQWEIEACASEKVRKEKYYAWKLLERAVQDFLGASITDLRFTKSENGKWKSDRVEFSLSHSASAVAVALSNAPVGVDIQRVAPLKRTDFLRKVLTEEELAELTKPETFIGAANIQTEEYLTNVVKPLLEEYKEDLGVDVKITV